jgi:hypothetical protein
MVRALPLFFMTGLLAGCASGPAIDETEPAPETQLAQLSCYQARWQAETVPVIYKRGGLEVWDRYEFMPQVGNVACR